MPMGYKKEPKCPVPPAQKPGGGSGKVYFVKFNFSKKKNFSFKMKLEIFLPEIFFRLGI
jgi:hypothetical protein